MSAPVAELVRRSPHRLDADPSRVLARLFVPGRESFEQQESRASPVLERLLALDEGDVERAYEDVITRFGTRHRGLEDTFRRHAEQLAYRLERGVVLSDTRRSLIGATFTNECAIEGAALCNPSVVAHPDQEGVPIGSLRFVMSVRGIGEGHRSSIGFRTGVIDAAGDASLDPPPRFAATGRLEPVEGQDRAYSIHFTPDTSLSERVLWPATAAESNGMEDARFVRFVDEDGSVTYFATYTAYDGAHISQQLLTTTDFCSFTSAPIVGAAAANKGLALFPRRIGGRHAALSRSDRESNAVTFSDDPRSWRRSSPCQVPTTAWEVLQLGNCGPPMETDAGWLVLTHGVGPMRTYSIGAILLDLDDPTRVIGHLREPLLRPTDSEQDGYVPNVVYSCGAILHADTLVLPYGIGDRGIGIASVPLPALIAALVHRTPERLNDQGATMPEKSPQKPAGKKVGKSLKEKRQVKKDKKEGRTLLGH